MASADLEEGEIVDSDCPPSPAKTVHDRDEALTPTKSTPNAAKKPTKHKGTKAQRKSLQAGGRAQHDVLQHVYGFEGRASVQLQYVKVPLLKDVQSLVLWVLAEGCSPTWAFVKNKPLIHTVVMVAVPGIDAALYQKADLPHLKQHFGRPVEVAALNGTVRQVRSIATLFSVPYTRKRKRYLDQLAEGMCSDSESKRARVSFEPQHAPESTPFPPSHYCMTQKQIGEREFPEWMRRGPARDNGVLHTRPTGAAEDDPAWQHMVAVDCEMCITDAGFELTRLSLTDAEGKVLMDELVLPELPITDYNTQFSGITAAMLAPVSTRLADVQRRFCDVVHAETLLVGHSLENDLKALHIAHFRLLDTSVLFPHPKGPPQRSKLKYLASRFLRRDIQGGAHDSVQDARAAMDLVLLKIRNGPAYGVFQPYEPTGDPLLQILSGCGVKCSMVDRRDALNRHVTGNANALPCTSDRECADKALRELANPALGFIWTQFRDLNAFHEVAAARQAQEPYRLAKGPAAGLPAHSAGQELAPPFPWQGWLPAAPRATHADAPSPAAASQQVVASLPAAPPHQAAPAASQPAAADDQPAARAGPGPREAPGAGHVELEPPSVAAAAAAAAVHTRSPEPDAANEQRAQPAACSNGHAEAGPHISECATEAEGAAASSGCQESEADILHRLDGYLGQLYHAAEPNTLFIVPTCQGATGFVRLMQERKIRAERKLDGLPAWNADCGAKLAKASARASKALCFVVVKQ